MGNEKATLLPTSTTSTVTTTTTTDDEVPSDPAPRARTPRRRIPHLPLLLLLFGLMMVLSVRSGIQILSRRGPRSSSTLHGSSSSSSSSSSPSSSSSSPSPTDDPHLSAAHRLLATHPLIDGHNDLLIMLRTHYANHITNTTFPHLFTHGGLPGELDLPRVRSGRMGGAFWSAFLPCPSRGRDFSNANYLAYVRATFEQLDLFGRLADLYPDVFHLVGRARDALPVFEAGKLVGPLGIEGLHQIGNSASVLREYYALGVRYATLTWNCHNKYADAALEMDGWDVKVAEPLHGGVSVEGRALIGEMNRLGMLVDLSHVSVDTMRDVLAGRDGWGGSVAPPIFSHSSVKAICPHPRNVPDDVLELVKERNAVVMINFNPEFVSCEEAPDRPGALPVTVNATNTLAQVVDHIRYVGDRYGWDYVGIGTDFDGIDYTPVGLEGVDKFPDLVAELLRQGVAERDIVKLVGGNILRVWNEADKVAERMKKEGVPPLEDNLNVS